MVAGAAVAQFSGFLLELVFYGVLQRLLEIPDFRNWNSHAIMLRAF